MAQEGCLRQLLRMFGLVLLVAVLIPLAHAAHAQDDAPARVGSIQGVVRAADGSPIDTAAVYVYDFITGENLGLAFTAPDGWYSIDYLLPGEYLVRAVDMHSVPQYAGGAHSAQAAQPVSVTAGAVTGAVDFALQPAAFFAGVVTRADGVTPLARAAVYAYDAETGAEAAWVETRADGSYTLVVPPGAYRLTAYQFDYQARHYHSDRTRADAEAVSVTAGETRSSIDFPLSSVGIVSGAVYQPDGVTPAGGVTVFVYDSPTATVHTYSTTTLPNGTYSRAVIAGTYYIGTTNASFGSVYYNQKLNLAAADAVSIPANTQVGDIVMRYFGLSGGATLLGDVGLEGRASVTKPNPRWSVPVNVTITPQSGGSPIYIGTVNTNDNGILTIADIPPGAYTIRIKGTNTLAAVTNVTLISGGNSVALGTLRAGNANGDDRINVSDFVILAATFGRAQGGEGYDARADFNGDNVVNINDFSLLAANFGLIDP